MRLWIEDIDDDGDPATMIDTEGNHWLVTDYLSALGDYWLVRIPDGHLERDWRPGDCCCLEHCLVEKTEAGWEMIEGSRHEWTPEA